MSPGKTPWKFSYKNTRREFHPVACEDPADHERYYMSRFANRDEIFIPTYSKDVTEIHKRGLAQCAELKAQCPGVPMTGVLSLDIFGVTNAPGVAEPDVLRFGTK